MSHLNAGEAHPLRHSNSDGGGGTALQRRFGNGGGGLDQEELNQGLKSAASEKSALSSKAFPRVESNLSMLDDDDVCPTCLDGIGSNPIPSVASIFSELILFWLMPSVYGEL